MNVCSASLVAQMVKNLPAMRETMVQSLGWEDPLDVGHGNPLQHSCLDNPHGQRSLGSYGPWRCKGSETTEVIERACVCVRVRTHTHTNMYITLHFPKRPFVTIHAQVPLQPLNLSLLTMLEYINDMLSK